MAMTHFSFSMTTPSGPSITQLFAGIYVLYSALAAHQRTENMLLLPKGKLASISEHSERAPAGMEDTSFPVRTTQS